MLFNVIHVLKKNPTFCSLKNAVNKVVECRMNKLDLVTLAKILHDNPKFSGCPSVVRTAILCFRWSKYWCLTQNSAATLRPTNVLRPQTSVIAIVACRSTCSYKLVNVWHDILALSRNNSLACQRVFIFSHDNTGWSHQLEGVGGRALQLQLHSWVVKISHCSLIRAP